MVRGRVELPTFRFSARRTLQPIAPLAKASITVALPLVDQVQTKQHNVSWSARLAPPVPTASGAVSPTFES